MALKAENEQQVRNWKINRTPLGGDLAFFPFYCFKMTGAFTRRNNKCSIVNIKIKWSDLQELSLIA